MRNLQLKGSDKTPYYDLNANGELSFGGISMPEDAATFYFEVMDWISDYYRTPSQETNVHVSFVYLNTSSSSMIYKIFHALMRLQKSGKTTIICNWYYEVSDDNMRDYIEEIQEMAKEIKFIIHPKDDILTE